MGIELTVIETLIGLSILIWIFGKALRSIPTLYRESRNKDGSEIYGDLTILLGFRVFGVLVLLGIFAWTSSKLEIELMSEDILTVTFTSLFIAGFLSFFVLITTFLIAKLNRFRRGVEESDILDEIDRPKP